MKKVLGKLLMVLVVITVLSVGYYTVFGDKIKDLQDEIDEISKQQSDTLKKLSATQKEIDSSESEVKELDKDIAKYQSEVDELNAKVATITEEVDAIEAELQESSTNFQSTKDKLDTRLKALYENGFVNVWEILFTSSGVTDFLAKYNVVISLLEYDKKVLDALQNQKEYISNKKRDAELRKIQIEQVQYDANKSKQALESAKSSKQAKIGQLEVSKKKLSEIKAKLQKELEQSTKRLKAEMAANGSWGNSFTGDFVFPVQMTSNVKPIITTRFGQWYKPFSKCTQHWWGIDVASSGSNRNLLAVTDGIVELVAYDKNGWGNYLIINHGKSTKDGALYKSRYAHCASIKVKKGQAVAKGEVIAVMGTTGSSTGIHLDFSLSKNGTFVNPLPYYGGTNNFRHMYTESCK